MQNSLSNLVVVMSGDKNYAFAIGNVLTGLKKHNPNLVDKVVIFQDKFDNDNKNAILKLYKNTEFIDYTPNYNPYLEKIVQYNKETKRSKWPYFCYACFEVFNIISTCKYVVYLDGDVIIKSDISNIINFGTISLRSGGRPLDVALGVSNDELHKIKCRNTGVVVIRNDIDFDGITNECYEMAYKYRKTNKLPDQSIINLVLARNKINISDLPHLYNDNLDGDVKHYIIHQTTSKKFWNNGIISLLEPEFEENEKIFQDLGGTKYNGSIKYKYALKWKRKKLMSKFLSLIEIYEFYYKLMMTKARNILINYRLNILESENILYASFDVKNKTHLRYELIAEPDYTYIKLYTNNRYYIKDINCEDLKFNYFEKNEKCIFEKQFKFLDIINDNFFTFIGEFHLFIESTYTKICNSISLSNEIQKA